MFALPILELLSYYLRPGYTRLIGGQQQTLSGMGCSCGCNSCGGSLGEAVPPPVANPDIQLPRPGRANMLGVNLPEWLYLKPEQLAAVDLAKQMLLVGVLLGLIKTVTERNATSQDV